jgi:hypothetical protein
MNTLLQYPLFLNVDAVIRGLRTQTVVALAVALFLFRFTPETGIREVRQPILSFFRMHLRKKLLDILIYSSLSDEILLHITGRGREVRLILKLSSVLNKIEARIYHPQFPQQL